MKQYSFEKPAYCVLSVLIIRVLHVTIVIGVVTQFFRFGFIVVTDSWNSKIVEHNYWSYYLYQVIMNVVPPCVEFVYLAQMFEWLAMIQLILSQKSSLIEEIMFEQQNPHHSITRIKK